MSNGTSNEESNELRVLTAHLNELAAKQGEAAATMSVAVAAVHGAGASVASTHGSIASATADAVCTAETARGTAGERLTRRSHDVQDNLIRAARRYQDTDESSAANLGGTVQHR